MEIKGVVTVSNYWYQFESSVIWTMGKEVSAFLQVSEMKYM